MVEEKRFTRMPLWLEGVFIKLRKGTEHLDYGRDIIVDMAKGHFDNIKRGHVNILDIGAGNGIDLRNVKKCFRGIDINLYAVDCYEKNVNYINKQGISASTLSIERDNLPFNDHFFDLVIANQIIEHAKDIFFIFSEVSRVLKIGGVVIVGFPNLAALHNRVLLLLGEQPACIRMPGPHIRGITKNAFTNFITCDGHFEVLKVRGSNFYPFNAFIARRLSRRFPSLSTSLFFLCRRMHKKGRFIDVLKTRSYETDYFTGQ